MLNPIQKNHNGGCLPNKKDGRDIALGDLAAAQVYVPDPNCPTYEQSFGNEQKYGRLHRDHQGSSLSCVGQGWSKYQEMLDLIEMIKAFVKKHDIWPSEIKEMLKNLSAKDIYSQIHLPNGCAYIRDGAKIAVNLGCCEESLIPSYDNGENPTEAFMQRDEQTDESREDALIYKSKLFVWLPTSYPMTEQDWENVRQVIWQFGGFVSGYGRHCIYFEGYGVDPSNGLRYIEYINSYGKVFGEDGKGKWFENLGQRLFDITFLVDQPNVYPKTKMKKVILDTTNDRQYVVAEEIHHIPDVPTRDFLLQFNWIVPEIENVEDISAFEIGRPIPSVLNAEKKKEIEFILDDALKLKETSNKFFAGFILGKIYHLVVEFLKGRVENK